MNECCNFHDLCELWNAHYNTMLQSITILATIFGFGLPSLAAWFQHRSLREERELMNKDIERKLFELDDLRKLISQQDSKINKLQKLLSDAYIASAQFYVNECWRAVRESNGSNSKENKKEAIVFIFSNMSNAIECGVNSGRQENLINVLNTFLDDDIGKFIFEDQQPLEEAIDVFKQDITSGSSVKPESIVALAGADNETYKKFAEKYKSFLGALKGC